VNAKEFSKAKDMEILVSLEVSNTGQVGGDEVVQLYVKDIESSVIQPEKELREFKRISIAAGETKTVQLQLSYDDFTFWNENTGDFDIEEGKFEIQLGGSSQDIRLSESIEIMH
jgi:beta-glucosidase